MMQQIYHIKISIHAPAKGATTSDDPSLAGKRISIHAPAKGATVCGDEVAAFVDIISIHAPAKGATNKELRILFDASNFNPRSREGSDG